MRTKKSVKNIIFGIGGQLFNNVLSFFNRSIFIYALGASYLGVNGLFTNILSMLSLAELGIGSAIIFNLYKPLAKNDHEKIKSLMKLYEKSYRIIGITVGVIGILLIPFLDYIIKDKPNISNITLIYIMFLLNSVVSYFFVYKSSLIIADQKNYIVTIKRQQFILLQTILQIIILLITKNYILYLAIQIIVNILSNVSISNKADKLYPFLKDKDTKELDKKSKKEIFKHIIAMMSHKVGGIVVDGTDNILLSSFVGVYWVGIYSNYVMLMGILNSFIGQIFTGITASIGNLNAEDNIKKSYKVYKKMLFINFWLYGFATIGFAILVNPFIKLWIGEKYILKYSIVIVIVINFYLRGMRQTNIMFNTTLGLFWRDRYKPWIESIINLSVSILLLKNFGVVGVFLGTLTSTITTSLWIEPYILFKYGFNIKLKYYFLDYIKYMIITIAAGITTFYFTRSFIDLGYIGFIISLIICILIPNSIFLICFIKSEEVMELKSTLNNMLRKFSNLSRSSFGSTLNDQ